MNKFSFLLSLLLFPLLLSAQTKKAQIEEILERLDVLDQSQLAQNELLSKQTQELDSLRQENKSLRQEARILQKKLRELAQQFELQYPNISREGSLDGKIPPSIDARKDEKIEEPLTEIAFEKNLHQFGQIAPGTVSETSFRFQNTGKYPLFISRAYGSCGCTVAEFPRNPIAPGGRGEIKVRFNSRGRKGPQDKRITVEGNFSPSQYKLRIQAKVE